MEPFSAERYFATQPPPAHLSELIGGVRDFVDRNHQRGRRIVLSGGTTVPLELNVVRFLDNFSAGTRGATSAEYFLSKDYAVIFLHRQFSQQPFLRHYSHSTNPFLDLLEIEEPGGNTDDESSPPRIVVNPSPEALPLLLRVLRENKRVKQLGILHTVTFVTVDDYLFLLRGIAGVLGGKDGVGRNAMYYLAAAVSDFFLPRQKMSEHKIQSGKGSLQIEMDQVPKILKPLVDEWTPEGFIVSFKLETDSTILIPKARAALERYGHQVVIGNELHSRKYKVVFVEKEGPRAKTVVSTPSSTTGGYKEEWIHVGEEGSIEIEKLIVEKLVERHTRWIGGA
ncbi:DFP-domain-containing protein [Serendipita vermifera]|nr:DFP-domain-containing protein [Serendipita vermifera]